MKTVFIFSLLLFAACFETACTTNPETGATELFGLVPVDAVVETVEPVAQEAKSAGGILGIAGTVVAGAIAYWRRRKELAEKSNAEKAKAVAVSVIDGVDAILSKIDNAKDGGGWAPTKDELCALLKAAQTAAGTRDDVKQILAEKAAT